MILMELSVYVEIKLADPECQYNSKTVDIILFFLFVFAQTAFVMSTKQVRHDILLLLMFCRFPFYLIRLQLWLEIFYPSTILHRHGILRFDFQTLLKIQSFLLSRGNFFLRLLD